MKAIAIRTVAVLTTLVALFPLAVQAAENPAFWKHQVKGEFATVLANLKAGLEARQFTITGEENLAKGLENNKQVFGADKWNTIGFQDATSVHFCSLVLNQEVFNLNMDWSILCPFKVTAYTMKNKPGVVTLITVRPSYLLARDPHPKAKEIGRKIERQIIEALREGSAQ
ncbi:MAG: DUF302 domain-containing protein [Betaproteobacteria bacterium]|nr:DUF302 domain-containing protein [Betaproteobacteria bacterium]